MVRMTEAQGYPNSRQTTSLSLLARVLRLGALPMQYDDIAHLHDEVARSLLREQRGEFLFRFLEFVELHFEQLVMLQSLVDALDELRTQPGFAHLERRTQPLRCSFEPPQFRVGQTR